MKALNEYRIEAMDIINKTPIYRRYFNSVPKINFLVIKKQGDINNPKEDDVTDVINGWVFPFGIPEEPLYCKPTPIYSYFGF